jgi:hypothetical protein
MYFQCSLTREASVSSEKLVSVCQFTCRHTPEDYILSIIINYLLSIASLYKLSWNVLWKLNAVNSFQKLLFFEIYNSFAWRVMQAHAPIGLFCRLAVSLSMYVSVELLMSQQNPPSYCLPRNKHHFTVYEIISWTFVRIDLCHLLQFLSTRFARICQTV